MSVTYHYCTPNNYMALLQHQLYDATWNISNLITFLRCIPYNYDMDDKEIKQKTESYYIIFDPKYGPVFNIYLKIPIQIVVIHPPRVPNQVYSNIFNYNEVSNLYKKKRVL